MIPFANAITSKFISPVGMGRTIITRQLVGRQINRTYIIMMSEPPYADTALEQT